MGSKRIGAFDIAKGVAIIAVIVGHSDMLGVSTDVRDFCFSFHMPLFFLVSGYFCRPDARLDGALIRKNMRGLVLPYVATCLVIIALAAVKYAIFAPEEVLDSTVSWLVAGLYGAGAVFPGVPEGIPAIGAIWFLLALFWARLMIAVARRTPVPLVVVAALFVAGQACDEF